MTKYWIQNYCSIDQNTIFSNWNAQSFRKGLYTELFFLFLIYFVSQVFQSLVYKQTNQRNPDQRQLRQAMTPAQSDHPKQNSKQLPWHTGRWKKQFAMIFSTNCISVSMCVLFSPFVGSIIIAYIHLLLFIIYVVMELKLLTFPAKIVRILMDVCNLTLILIGTASINLNKCNSDFTCKGVNQGVLSQQICFG